MDDLEVIPNEHVCINGKDNKERIETYIIPGKRGSKCCEMNGGAANFFKKGDRVHLLFFAYASNTELTFNTIIINLESNG